MSSQEFANFVNSSDKPIWKDWSDSTKEQYFNLMNAEQANQHEIEMWRLNNAYNTPKAQMERMIEAGLNPAVAYDQISSGTSSSSPGTHMSGTPKWHDTQDKLATVNTIMNGISSIMGSISNGVNAVQSIQDIGINQPMFNYNTSRASYYGRNFYPSLFDSSDGLSNPVQISPGVYAPAEEIARYPEFFKPFKDAFKGGQYDLGVAARSDQHSLVERRSRMDKLVQDIFKKVDQGASASELLPLFLQLFTYGILNKSGFGY